MTDFAIRLDDGRYRLSSIEHPQYYHLVGHPPEKVVVLAENTYDQVKESPIKLREAVVGTPNVLQQAAAALKIYDPLVRAGHSMDKLDEAITTWVEHGRGDHVSCGMPPDTLKFVETRLELLAGFLSKRSTQKAVIATSHEHKVLFQGMVRDLTRSLARLNEINLSYTSAKRYEGAFKKLREFCVDTGLDIRLSVQFPPAGVREMGMWLLKRSAQFYRLEVRGHPAPTSE